jgi:hypothetical protein
MNDITVYCYAASVLLLFAKSTIFNREIRLPDRSTSGIWMFSLRDPFYDGESDPEPMSSSESAHSSQNVDAPSDRRSSSSGSSYYSVETQPPAAIDENEDAESILAFIATLDAAIDTNETGWTYKMACLALDAKRSRSKLNPDHHESEQSPFDFFSHLDPSLRSHLRESYARRQRWGYTGDVPQGMSLDIAMLPMSNAQSIVHVIQAAIAAPVKESEGQALRRRNEDEMDRENLELDEFDQRFEGTWRGIFGFDD